MSQQAIQTYTYREYVSWADDERWEIIEGKPRAMSPAPGRAHQRLLGGLFYQIYGYLRGRPCEVYAAPFDVRLARDDEPDDAVTTVVQPDISVICDLSKLDDRGCRGAPDWVIEILSPATAARDQIDKLAAYEAHGVKHYWLVHPIDRVATVYVLGPDGSYGRPSIHPLQGILPSGLFEDLIIDWDAI